MSYTSKEYIQNEKINALKIFPEDNNSAIELLEPTSENSVIQKYLNKNGPGIHHVALTVDSINEAILYLKFNNITLVYDNPQPGADNKLITFIHPQSTPGLLIELCQRT